MPEYLSVWLIPWTSYAHARTHTDTHRRPPWMQRALSFFLSLHFPAVYFGQLLARSHSAAVPMVIAAEIANGGLGWWA